MSIEEEVWRIKAEVVGVASYENLEKQLKENEQWQKALNSAFASGTITEAQFSQQTAQLTRESAALSRQTQYLKNHFAALAAEANVVESELDQVANKALRADQALDKVGKTATDVKGKSGQLGQTIQTAGYAFQDFTSTTGDMGQKLNSISNNLPQLLSAFGTWGKVAAVVATAGVVIYRNWTSVLWMFGQGQAIPKATNDLEGLKEQIQDVDKELTKLKEQGWLSDSDFTRYNELERTKKQLKEQEKAAETIKKLGELKSELEANTIKAFQSALGESGSKKQLDILKKDFAASPNPAMKAAFTTVINALEEGNLGAYDALIDLLEGKFGPNSKFAMELKEKRPLALPDIDPFEERAREVKDANREAFKAMSKTLNQLGADIQEDMMKELGENARQELGKNVQKNMEQTIVRLRAAGSKGKKEFEYLVQKFADEMKMSMPELVAFPATLVNIAEEMARRTLQSVDEMVKNLQQLEGMTKEEALRRLAQQEAEKKQGQKEGIAADAFTEFFRRENARRRVQAPEIPSLTAEQVREQGAGMRQELKERGVGPVTMGQMGRLLLDPRTAPLVGPAQQFMMQQGMDIGEATRRVPELIGQAQRGGGFAGGFRRMMELQQKQQRAAANARAKALRLGPRQALPRGLRQMPPGLGMRGGRGGIGAGMASVAPGTKEQLQMNGAQINNQGKLIGATGGLANAIAQQKQIVQAQTASINQIAMVVRQLQTHGDHGPTALNMGRPA